MSLTLSAVLIKKLACGKKNDKFDDRLICKQIHANSHLNPNT